MVKSFSFNGYNYVNNDAESVQNNTKGAVWTMFNNRRKMKTAFVPNFIPLETVSKIGCPSRTKYIKCRREDVVRILNGYSFRAFRLEDF